MAFDHENHTIDPATGYQIHKDTGHRIGLDPAPARAVDHDPEWPKWIPVHDSHVVRRKVDGAPDHVSVPAFPEYHVNRGDGLVTVLVRNEDEEKAATGEAKEPEAPVPVDDAARRAVVADVARAARALAEGIAREEAAQHARLVAEEAARRTAEQQELAERNRAAAEELAEKQRARLAENLAKSPPVDRDARLVAEREAAERDGRASQTLAENERARLQGDPRLQGGPTAAQNPAEMPPRHAPERETAPLPTARGPERYVDPQHRADPYGDPGAI
jgi:hypothetical protein